MEWLRKLWRRQQRSVDLRVLWPLCRDHASSLFEAHRAFESHCRQDEAWMDDYTEQTLAEFIKTLS